MRHNSLQENQQVIIFVLLICTTAALSHLPRLVLIQQNMIRPRLAKHIQLVDPVKTILQKSWNFLSNHPLLRWHTAQVQQSPVLQLCPSNSWNLVDVVREQSFFSLADEVGDVETCWRNVWHCEVLVVHRCTILMCELEICFCCAIGLFCFESVDSIVFSHIHSIYFSSLILVSITALSIEHKVITKMLLRLHRSVNCINLIKSNPIFVRNSHNQSAAVALAFNEYAKSESKAAPFIVMHGLFGSKSNWWEKNLKEI